MNKLKKYSLGIVALLLTVSCAQQNFEWIKINPDKIVLARKTMPYTESIRKVDMTLQMQEKSEPVYYNESETYFNLNKGNDAPAATPEVVETDLKKEAGPKSSTLKKQVVQKSTVKIPPVAPVYPAKSVKEEEESVSKLNDALKIPVNKKIKTGNIPHTQIKATPKKDEAQESKLSAPSKEEKPVINKENSTKVKAANSAEITQKGKSLMLGGGILVVIGLVLGFIFGRSAFWISAAGLAFAIVGYFIK